MIKKLWAWTKRCVVYVWWLALIVLGMWILHENRESVVVNYLGLWRQEQSLGMVIVQALLLGFLLGLFTNYLSAKARIYVQKRQVVKANRELEKLKNSQSLQ